MSCVLVTGRKLGGVGRKGRDQIVWWRLAVWTDVAARKRRKLSVVGLNGAEESSSKETAVGGQDWFVKTVLIDGLKVDPGQVFCLRWNPADNGYDVTLHSQVMYDRVLMTCKAESVPFSLFKVEPLGQRNVRVITVHMYNPYGKVDKPVKYLRDNYGIWSGRRQFRVLLGEDPESGDGLRHPPAYFSLGGERVFLFYSGQLSFCRQCRSFGHLAAGCTLIRCRNCGGEGHGAASCSQPKTCNGCGKTGHLFRVCPSSGRTYAAVAGESLGPSLGPLVEEPQDVQGVKGDLSAGKAATAAEADPDAKAIPANGAEGTFIGMYSTSCLMTTLLAWHAIHWFT
ncbi:unnamed protein product [Menidia menidia]|uniref:(Atlantic silverside) hypothetical protein n=1 Tax=Menidia menidia TaxID=238744 RepID=A0A8S4BPJ1_9TELE|nr:unnamed protein product [Menidia menidia]